MDRLAGLVIYEALGCFLQKGNGQQYDWRTFLRLPGLFSTNDVVSMFSCLNNAAMKSNIVDKSLFTFWVSFKFFEEKFLGQKICTCFKVYGIYCRIAVFPVVNFFNKPNLSCLIFIFIRF